jgi:hypothetical protein
VNRILFCSSACDSQFSRSGNGDIKLSDFGVSEFIIKNASGDELDLSSVTSGSVLCFFPVPHVDSSLENHSVSPVFAAIFSSSSL